jgi:hypothetical protein
MIDALAFYSSKQWRRLRAAYRKAHPFCQRCGRRTEHVDHVEEIRLAPERRLDWLNLQSLCHACHNAKTAADKAGQPLRPHGGCDVDGNPTDPRHPWSSGAGRGGIRAHRRVPVAAARSLLFD